MKSLKYILLLVLGNLTACSLAPIYQRPQMIIPSDYKETGHWLKISATNDKPDNRTWWKMYQDPELNNLIEQVNVTNENLRAEVANYAAARAAVGVARSAYFPTINLEGNSDRQQSSGNVANKIANPLYSDQSVALDLSYEVDLWGKIRNSVASAQNLADATAADLAALNLSLQAELTTDYFSLRATDFTQRIYDQTVFAYQKAYTLTRNRFKGGAAPIADVDVAKSQLENAKTLAADNRLRRAQLEHALALLIGKSPAEFTLPPNHRKFTRVTVAPSLPASLLQRRPDIVAAELRTQAANANIGVARAAYFPDVNLAAGIGVESAVLKNLFKAPSLIWSLGPSSGPLNISRAPLINYIVFDGGRTSALTTQAFATYEQNAALYRQTVLTAFREVEDSLVALRQLDHENKTQALATSAANRSLQQALNTYNGGITTYLDVVVVQNIALQSQLNAINLETRRQVASVQLLKALGGGWS